VYSQVAKAPAGRRRRGHDGPRFAPDRRCRVAVRDPPVKFSRSALAGAEAQRRREKREQTAREGLQNQRFVAFATYRWEGKASTAACQHAAGRAWIAARWCQGWSKSSTHTNLHLSPLPLPCGADGAGFALTCEIALRGADLHPNTNLHPFPLPSPCLAGSGRA